MPVTSGPDLTGQELGDYHILRRLGTGGMAEVYLAEQRSLGRQVALKVLNHSLASDTSYVQRFQNEARAAASLVHPNIVQIYEVGQADGVHFIAQEYVAGKNLGQLLEREGAFVPALVLDVLRQVVSALCKAHELEIVHRDIKPENILLSHSGEVKVADFGLARVQNTDTKTLTQVGVAMGTPLYMSPEQVEGRPVDARSDIYSLGVSSYHLLAGVPPHTGDTALAIAVQHLHNTPEPLENVRVDIPSALARVVHKMLAKKPGGRPASPSELLVELRELAKSAAAEGWAAGPEEWSLSELIATEPARSRKSEELEQVMQAEARLQPGARNWRRLAVVLAAAAVAGLVIGAVTRPRFYLGGRRAIVEVPDQSSAWAQIYHAQTNPTIAAWMKAIDYPDADPYVKQLAERGLLRYYLLVSQEYLTAMPRLGELERTSQGDDKLEGTRIFSLAGLCICCEKLGQVERARELSGIIDARMQDRLDQEEPQIAALLRRTRERLQSTEAAS
ncbi:MAG: serine/threonine-protein kinase [Planctomycetota bacterium]